jgi:hypothetical protein
VTPNPVVYLSASEIHERINGLLGKITASLCARSLSDLAPTNS